jgi:hypothetical protein
MFLHDWGGVDLVSGLNIKALSKVYPFFQKIRDPYINGDYSS